MTGPGRNGKGDGNAGNEHGDETLVPAGVPDEDAGADAPAEPATEAGLVEAPTPGESLETLRRERDELKESLLRRRAEFENYRKRAERDQRNAAVEAVADALRRLVESLDNLERALSAPGGEGALRQGVELTLRDLRAAFESQGVAVLDPAGERFDPVVHQALAHEAVPGVPDGTVAEVFRKGYSYKDRLLRPALVKVSSGPDVPGGGTDEGQGAD